MDKLPTKFGLLALGIGGSIPAAAGGVCMHDYYLLEGETAQGKVVEYESLGLASAVEASPTFSLPPETLRELSSAEDGLPDLSRWTRFSYTCPQVATAEGISEEEEEHLVNEKIEGLTGDDQVQIVSRVPVPPPQLRRRRADRRIREGTMAEMDDVTTFSFKNLTPDFTDLQSYLRANTEMHNGIDAEYSWSFEGGSGKGVTIYDIEYDANPFHEDLGVLLEGGNSNLLTQDGGYLNPFDSEHGTAVFGVMLATKDNGIGIVGISHGAKGKLASEMNANGHPRRANAIVLATNDAKPGDVILLEMQTNVCGLGLGPAEWDLAVRDATKVAVANGIVVVATAGNGGVNLDAPRCFGAFDRERYDSGAIFVDAGGSGRFCEGGSPRPREKMEYSPYGRRMDLQGWGECITTAGYGEGLYGEDEGIMDNRKFYTDDFGGTSGAGPFVAAAAANIQGIALAKFGKPLKPLQLRSLLVNTGIPQQFHQEDRDGDKEPMCPYYASIGDCENDPEFMRSECPESCNIPSPCPGVICPKETDTVMDEVRHNIEIRSCPATYAEKCGVETLIGPLVNLRNAIDTLLSDKTSSKSSKKSRIEYTHTDIPGDYDLLSMPTELEMKFSY